MLGWRATVGQDVGVGAARRFEGVGEDGEAVEAPLLIDAPAEPDHGGRELSLIEGRGAERVAE